MLWMGQQLNPLEELHVTDEVTMNKALTKSSISSQMVVSRQDTEEFQSFR